MDQHSETPINASASDGDPLDGSDSKVAEADSVMFEEVDLFDTALVQGGHGDVAPSTT